MNKHRTWRINHCEITEGRDFFEWREPVDWIVGNPPYSVINRWLEHSFSVADPLWKMIYVYEH